MASIAREFPRENRQAMGMPSNIAVIDGKPVSGRALSSSFSSHREKNNDLAPLDDGSSNKKRKSSLRPNRAEFENRKPAPPVTPTPHAAVARGSSNFAEAPTYLPHASYESSVPNYSPTGMPYASHPPQHLDGGEEAIQRLDGYERVMNFTAMQIAHGTMSKLHVDVDSGTETVEAIIDPIAQVAGKRMRCMSLNEDITRPTSNRYAELSLELNSQEIAGMIDTTWECYYSPEKRASK
jgi:hypothetical protein